MGNYLHCRSYLHPQLLLLLQDALKNYLIFRKCSVAYYSCSSLSACIMVTSICLAILISILCHRNCEHLIREVCECLRSSVLIRILPLAQTSLRTWAGVRQIKPWLIVDLCLFNLLVFDQSLCFWSLDLKIIIPLHLSYNDTVVSIAWFPCILSSSGWVLILTPDPLWPSRSIAGFYPTTSFIFNNLVSFSSDT